GERGVADLTTGNLDLLHYRQAQSLGRTALDLTTYGVRIHCLADVLAARQLHHLHEAELHVHVDDRAVRGEGVLHVHPLTGTELVQRERFAVVNLAGLVDALAAARLGELAHWWRAVPDRAVGQRQLNGIEPAEPRGPLQ